MFHQKKQRPQTKRVPLGKPKQDTPLIALTERHLEQVVGGCASTACDAGAKDACK